MPAITIATVYGPREIMADVFGLFAVHHTIQGEPCQFHLTHVPTGFAVLERVSYDNALAAAKELEASGLDWSNISQETLTPEHKAFGKALRQKYPPDPVIHRQRRGGGDDDD